MIPAIIHKTEEKYHNAPPHSVDDLKSQMKMLNPDQLYRKKSTIPLSGNGLFSKTPFSRGDLITWYGGAYATKSEYDAIKAKDAEYRDYALALDPAGRQVMLGNYRRDDTGQLEKISYNELEDAHRNGGAMQFMNGEERYNDNVNVGSCLIYGKIRIAVRSGFGPYEDIELQVKTYPTEILRVAVALNDIPAGTEMIVSYGSGYFERSKDREKNRRDAEKESSVDTGSYDIEYTDDFSDEDDGDDDSDNDDDDSGSVSSEEDSVELREPPFKKTRYQCAACHRTALWQCSACKNAHYCSRKCQTTAWSSIHREACNGE